MSGRGASPRKGTPSRTTRAGSVQSTPLQSTPVERTAARSSARVEENVTFSRIERDSETPERPQSPGLLMRDDEKRQLSHLNNRLAAYIEHVNQLQGENSRLSNTLTRIEEQKTVEITSIKNDYLKEIQALRTLADAEAKEKAAANAEAQNLQKQLERLNSAHQALISDHDRANHRISILEKDNADMKARLTAALSELERTKKELALVSKDFRDSEAKLKDLSIKLSQATNQLESLRDQDKFQRETYEKELQTARIITQEEISEIDGRAQERYNMQLQEKIEEFRRVYEIEKREIRNKMEEEIAKRMAGFISMGDHMQLETRLKTMTQELTQVKKDLDDKKRFLEQERAWMGEQLRSKDEQIRDLNDQLRQLKKEFDDLLDIRDGLQKELDTYRVLLEQEESRLNISSSRLQSPSHSSSSSSLAGSSRKRKRLSTAFESTEGHEDIHVEFSNSGPITVSEHDAINGTFVVLENVSTEDVALGSWRLSHTSGAAQASHKFPARFKIKGKSKVTLWSSDSGGQHNPPNSYVLKDIKFPAHGEDGSDLEVVTTLQNSDDEVVAKRVSRKSQASRTTVRKFTGGTRSSTSRVSFATGPGEVFHMHGDEADGALDDSRCAIM